MIMQFICTSEWIVLADWHLEVFLYYKIKNAGVHVFSIIHPNIYYRTNLIGGMDIPTTGQVIVDGEDISKYNEDKLSRYRAATVGFIFQFYNILPTLTVLENVELVKDIVKNPLDAHEALAKVGLTEHENKFPNQLSGGEQQRISIARAVAKNPKVLLCDEPTGALDSATGVEVLKLLMEQCRKGGNTVIIVTHNSLIADIADTIVRVKNGKIKSVVDNPSPKNIEEVEW